MINFTGNLTILGDNAEHVENMMPSRYSGISSENEAKILFVGTARIMSPIMSPILSVVDTKSEFTSRHSLEWKFLFLDHRASIIIGKYHNPWKKIKKLKSNFVHFHILF